MKLESYLATTGSQYEQSQLDIISNNIANSNTPGYKKDTLSFSTVLGEVAHIDMSQGPTRQTGNNLDIALSGNGFLSVQTPQGALYTRAGDLAVDSSNQLVTQDGYPVLGQNGAPIKINTVADLRITSNGQVFDGNNSLAQLQLVDFAPNSLKKVGSGYFQPADTTVQPGPASGCTVHQGALEEANVNSVKEMALLIEATREFEADQKALKNGSTLDSELISKTSG
ncbi:MAG: flagellar basal-body rod protein FlgF [Syntrophobacteraceae bacterium]|nr:flagellar basal-body rod protein FlgF [Syntrophobacteraceae bacterium]